MGQLYGRFSLVEQLSKPHGFNRNFTHPFNQRHARASAAPDVSPDGY
jgi:hypothetical protein